MEECKQPNHFAAPVFDVSTVRQIFENGTQEEILELLQNVIDPTCTDENEDTLLHAILKNEKLTENIVIKIFTVLLTNSVDPNIKNKNEETALHLAVERRMVKVINLLLEFKANINAVDQHGNSIAHFFIQDEFIKCKTAMLYPLMNTPENREIAEKRTVSFLEFLISKGLDVDYENNLKQNPVQLACMPDMLYYLPHILATLLRYTKNEKNKKLLQTYLDKSSTTPVSNLLDEQFYPDWTRNDDNEKNSSSPISNLLDDQSYPDWTANDDNKKSSTSPISNLLDDQSYPDWTKSHDDKYNCEIISNAIKEKKSMSVIVSHINNYLKQCDDKNFAIAIYCELMSTCNFWNDENTDYFLTVLRELVAFGVSVKDQLSCKKYVLTAMKARNLQLLKFLKENGADFNFKSRYGKKVLHLLAEEKNDNESSSEFYIEFCNLLFSDNFDMNARDNQNNSALHTAARYGNISMVGVLLEFDIEVNCINYNMMTPLHVAVQMNQSVELIELLVTSGADVNAKDYIDETPLYLAISNNNVATVRVLLEHGASVLCENKYQETPLHRIDWQTGRGMKIIELLLNDYSKGEELIYLAISHNMTSIVRLLINKGVNVNCKDENRQTPLHRALMNNKALEIVKLLVAKGADVNAKDSNGKTPLDFAILSNKVAIVRLFMKRGAFDNDRQNENQEAPAKKSS